MASKIDILARRDRIQELESQGITSPRKIAETLGIPLRTVQDDLQRMNAEWAAAQLAARDEWKRRLVARAQRRYQQLEAEWERSKSDKSRERAKETTTTLKGQLGEAKVTLPAARVETEAAKEGRLGDPAFMREMRENDKLIAELLQVVPKEGEDPFAGPSMVIKVYGFNPNNRPGPRPALGPPATD